MPKRVAAAFAMLFTTPAPAPAEPRLAVAPLVSGRPAEIVVTGAPPGAEVRIDVVRRFSRWQQLGGQWREVPVTLRSWGVYRADGRGRTDASAAPTSGTYGGRDGYGLLWSGRRADDMALSGAPGLEDRPGDWVTARIGDRLVGSVPLRQGGPAAVRTVAVAEAGLNGVYAAPSDGRRHPLMLVLHGSEGGSADGARLLAQRFAARGFAAFALNYFAWDLTGLTHVARSHVNLPIELLAQARQWATRQPEADPARIGVYGHSKGAEFAEVAAVRFPWIDAVVACVPTDVIWEGYGSADERNRAENRTPLPPVASSWSWRGRPLPYVPLRPFNWREDANRYFDNTERYELSRRDHPERAVAAAIPVERSRATFLFLGGGRDEVWASGRMTEALSARMRRAGGSRRVEAHVYPLAGHQICGDGAYPPRVYQEQGSDPRSKDLEAEGAAAADAWERMVNFLERRLARTDQAQPRRQIRSARASAPR